ncbi:MAG: hypothetical protein ACUVXG_12675 [Anaerolineae bacterium]
MREILRQYLAKEDREAQRHREMQAIEGLTQIRRRVRGELGIYQGDLLAAATAERDEERERVWRGEP